MYRKRSFLVGVFACGYVALSVQPFDGLWAAPSSIEGQTLPAGVHKGPAMGGITQYDFPNGLTVLLYPDAAEPKITIFVSFVAQAWPFEAT